LKARGGRDRKLHGKELHNLYSSPKIIRMIKLRRIRWIGNEAHMRDMRSHTKYRLENLKGRDLLEYLGIHGRIRVMNEFIWLRIGTRGRLL
jgi:hypothetical protein